MLQVVQSAEIVIYCDQGYLSINMLIRPLICLLFAISCAIGLPVKEKPKETEQTAEKPSDDSPTQNLEVKCLVVL